MQYQNYSHFLIRKFINHLMVEGKKEKAERLMVSCFLDLVEKGKQDPFFVFIKAIENSKPYVELRSVRRGGATYQIPIPCLEKRGISLSMKWILEAARKRKGDSFSKSLSAVLIESSKNYGESAKKRDLIHAAALKNRSLTHFRWF
jgi:small subunit ribosomal protein S7